MLKKKLVNVNCPYINSKFTLLKLNAFPILSKKNFFLLKLISKGPKVQGRPKVQGDEDLQYLMLKYTKIIDTTHFQQCFQSLWLTSFIYFWKLINFVSHQFDFHTKNKFFNDRSVFMVGPSRKNSCVSLQLLLLLLKVLLLI